MKDMANTWIMYGISEESCMNQQHVRGDATMPIFQGAVYGNPPNEEEVVREEEMMHGKRRPRADFFRNLTPKKTIGESRKKMNMLKGKT